MRQGFHIERVFVQQVSTVPFPTTLALKQYDTKPVRNGVCLMQCTQRACNIHYKYAATAHPYLAMELILSTI
jgi:hypothetical protein